MLIELLKPRRNNTPVTLPDGTKVQFNQDASGRYLAEIANDQALLILRHKDVFARADGGGVSEEKPAPVIEAEVVAEPAVVERSVTSPKRKVK